MKKNNIFVHNSSFIDKGAVIGHNTKIWHFCHVMSGAKIGNNCNIGQNVFFSEKAIIGDNVKIQNNVSVYNGVILEDYVFCGPSVVFTNDLNPRSKYSKKENYLKTNVKEGASIGANATILCGITIGKHAFIGAGSIVTNNIPDYALVYGNPGRVKGWMCDCGVKLDFNNKNQAQCKGCSLEYQLKKNRVSLIK